MTDHQHDPMDDGMDAAVRRALAREAERVPLDPDGLYKIRERVDRSAPRSRRLWLTAAGAGVAAAAAVGVFAMLDRDMLDQTTDEPGIASTPDSGVSTGTTPELATPGADSPATPVTPRTSPGPTASAFQRSSDPTAPTRPAWAVPVYWLGRTVGRTDGEVRLYRSFVGVNGDPALGAVAMMASGRPADPDYQSPWVGARPLSVVRSGGIITVDFGTLPGEQLGAKESGTAVQQLVYTVQGALQASDPVKVTLKGGPAGRLFGQVDSGTPFKRAAPIDVQAWIWITSPAEGATVRSPVAVSGIASTFEATVNWRVRELSTNKVVRESFTTATAGTGQFGTFSFRVPLPSGKYQLECLEFSPEDGRETNTDTKTITVR
jgi:Immunoglobulin-like domain of bacterial spore germination/Sporulation and spore germination